MLFEIQPLKRYANREEAIGKTANLFLICKYLINLELQPQGHGGTSFTR